MTQRTETQATAYGEINIELVECTSCGNEVPKESASQMVLGDVIRERNFGAINKYKFTFDPRTLSRGWACGYCCDDPAVVPSKESSSKLADVTTLQILAFVEFLIIFVGGLLLL